MSNKRYKYTQIRDEILDKINKGVYVVGGQIPTEMDLCKNYNVGRMTVNKAINELVNKGVIRRISGKGSFVIKKASKPVGSFGGFTQDLLKYGMKAGSKLLEYKVYSYNDEDIPEEVKLLMPGPDNDLIYFKRLRTGDGVPVAISDTYLSGKFFKSFNPQILDGSLYEYFIQNGLNIDMRSNVITAVLATTKQKQQLEIPVNENIPLLKSISIRYFDKTPFEYTLTYYLCENFEYTFSTIEE